ncbi:hypothetical protein Lal_00015039 [Lupinus albus]|nr:hypothetical protein Lal_00015039 [Lupinus albus]
MGALCHQWQAGSLSLHERALSVTVKPWTTIYPSRSQHEPAISNRSGHPGRRVFLVPGSGLPGSARYSTRGIGLHGRRDPRAHVRAGVRRHDGPRGSGAPGVRSERDRLSRHFGNLFHHPRSDHFESPGQRRRYAIPLGNLLHVAGTGGDGAQGDGRDGRRVGRADRHAGAAGRAVVQGRGLPPELLRPAPAAGLLRIRGGAQGGQVPQGLHGPRQVTAAAGIRHAGVSGTCTCATTGSGPARLPPFRTRSVVRKAVCAAGQVDVPDTERLRIARRPDAVGIRLERARAGVVAAQVFHVAHFEAAFLHRADDGGQVRQLAVREHVFVDELAAAVRAVALFDVRRGDAVVHHDPTRRQQLVDAVEVRRQVVHAHVLEHADARDPVELAGDVAVVLQPDLDAVLQAGLRHALARQFVLALGQRDTHAARAEFAGRADHERAPAAADVEQRLARLHADLGEDVVDLLLLGRREVFVAVLEIGARVHHGRVEEQAVELVGDVVVVADGFRILLARVRRDEAQGRAGDAARARRLAGGFREGGPHLDHVGGAPFDLERAFDIGFPETAQRRGEEVAQAARVGHADLHAWLLGRQVDLRAIP